MGSGRIQISAYSPGSETRSLKTNAGWIAGSLRQSGMRSLPQPQVQRHVLALRVLWQLHPRGTGPSPEARTWCMMCFRLLFRSRNNRKSASQAMLPPIPQKTPILPCWCCPQVALHTHLTSKLFPSFKLLPNGFWFILCFTLFYLFFDVLMFWFPLFKQESIFLKIAIAFRFPHCSSRRLSLPDKSRGRPFTALDDVCYCVPLAHNHSHALSCNIPLGGEGSYDTVVDYLAPLPTEYAGICCPHSAFNAE